MRRRRRPEGQGIANEYAVQLKAVLERLPRIALWRPDLFQLRYRAALDEVDAFVRDGELVLDETERFLIPAPDSCFVIASAALPGHRLNFSWMPKGELPA